MSDTSVKMQPHPDDQRRAHNLAVGKMLCRAGIPVFVSFDKSPIIPLWNRRDTDLTDDDRETVRAKRRAKGKSTPAVIGSTLNADRWERMQRLVRRDGVASICCGLAGVVVIDADIKRDDETGEIIKHGPTLFAEFIDANGGMPGGVVTLTSQSGAKHHVFRDREGKYDNSEGGLSELGCNVRGRNGQIVAPGSWRLDGRRYGTLDDLKRFIDAINLDALPELPEVVAKLIGTKSGSTLSDGEPKFVALMDELHGDDWPDYEETFGPGGKFDIERVKASSPAFEALMDNPNGDLSANRFSVASQFKGFDSRFSVRDFAAFCTEHSEMCGEYVEGTAGQKEIDDRKIVRDFARSTSAEVQRGGEAMGSVVDEDEADEAEQVKAKASKLDRRVAYLEGELAKAESEAALEIGDAESRLAVLGDLLKVTRRQVEDVKTKGAKKAKPLITPRSLELKGIDEIGPREFIYRKWLMRGALTILLAPGGRGKSALTLSVAIDIACGVDRLGAALARPRPVFLYNAEDPIVEMERRAEAYMLFHGFSDEEKELVRCNLHIQSGMDGLLTFAIQDRTGVMANDPVVDGLTKFVKQNDIEVVILDPLVNLHSVPENDNNGQARVADVFKRIIKATNVALMIPHHVRKVQRGTTTLDANDGRGAVSTINSARAVLSINDLGTKADEFQITDEPWRYIAVTMGDKVNLSARDPSVVVFRLNSVQADNATDEFEADNTVAISLHKYVKQTGLSDEATANVLAALDDDEPVGSSPRHANWLGKLIAEAAGWNADAAHVRKDVKDVIAEWLRRKWIIATTTDAIGKGSDRRKAVGVFKRGDARPEAREYKFEAVEDDGDDDA
jgi:RecA-family ATPase